MSLLRLIKRTLIQAYRYKCPTCVSNGLRAKGTWTYGGISFSSLEEGPTSTPCPLDGVLRQVIRMLCHPKEVHHA